MKKVLIFIIVTALLAVGSYAAFYYLVKREVSLETILPQQPLVMLHQKNIAQNLQRLETHPAWVKLKEVDFDALSASSAKAKQSPQWWKMITENIFTAKNRDIFDKFFSKEAVVAVYPTDVNFSKLAGGNLPEIIAMVQEVFSQIFIVTKVGADVKAAEVMSRFSRIAGEDVQQETIEYKKRSIHLLNFPQQQVQIGLTIIGDWMVIGLGDHAAKKCIDVFSKDQVSLAQDKFWQDKKMVALDAEETFGYVDLNRFVGLMEGAVSAFKDKVGAGSAPVEDIFRNFRGFQSVMISGDWKNVMRSRMMVLYDKNQIDPSIAELYLACRDISNQTLNFVPKGILGYQWSNCTNPKYYWEQIKKEAYKADIGAPTSLDEQVKAFEQMLGFSIENDIIPAIGDEFGGYLADIEMGQPFPMPKLLLFLKIANQQKITALLQKFTEQPLLVIQKENYKGTELRYISIPISANIEPGYAFLNDYLLVAVDRRMLRDAIDTSQDPASALSTDVMFKSVDQGMTSPNSSTTFVRLDRLAGKAQELARWSKQRAAEQEIQQAAFKQGTEARLRDVRSEIEQIEAMTASMNEEATSLQTMISGIESRGEDATVKKNELAALRNDIDLKQKDIETARLQEKEIDEMLQEFNQEKPSHELSSDALEKAIVPLFDGIGELGVFGAWTKMTDNAVDNMMVISGN